MNKADISLGYVREINNHKPCYFISYKKEDQHIAIELGDFLEKLDVDIYLDVFDIDLQEAVSVENDEKILESITNGLRLSDNLLCIISDKTKMSWWVPYEIGVADKSGIRIASIKTKDIDDFPSFLKINETLNSRSDLIEFVMKNKKYGTLFYSEERKNDILQGDTGCLDKYFE